MATPALAPVQNSSGPLANSGPHLTKEELIVKQYLARAVEEFNGSVLGTRVIRKFASETPKLFCSAGLALLLDQPPSPGLNYLASLLLKQSELMRIVSDRLLFGKDEAIAVFRKLLTFDPGLDIFLAKSLLAREGRPAHEEIDGDEIQRALDILDATSNGRRIVLILNRLVEHSDARIASKALLVVGRRMQSVDWADRQIANQQDPRKRANAIETIWGIDTQKARDIMFHHSQDDNNRVVGNAAYGLHIIGDPRSQPLITRMAVHSDASFRWTAAWLMGQIGDAAFVGPLNQLVRDDCMNVKRASLRALVKLRREQMRQESSKPEIVTDESISPNQLEKLEQLAKTIDPTPDPAPSIELHLDGRHVSSSGR